MALNCRYVHTNLIAKDWRRLSAFYQQVFGCQPVPPERDYQSPQLDAGTGLHNTHLRGIHLRLPGWGEKGPTLELFNYAELLESPPTAVNRPGYGHIAFEVEQVGAARQAVLKAGGSAIGEVVTLSTADGRQVTWCYLSDPEGNIIELQSWA